MKRIIWKGIKTAFLFISLMAILILRLAGDIAQPQGYREYHEREIRFEEEL